MPDTNDVSSTNFHLAPPAKTVDGLLAVPIDIQRIDAKLSFDGATSCGSGDATLEFTMGPQDGNPIFDLRQTITAAWLDGTSVPVGKLAHHDFGGGLHAGLRVAESMQAAHSAHTLRVQYDLGLPDASPAGSYQPHMTWSPGPRLTFNFGFTDLGAGRYLEAWIPANLIFDQFELGLELEIVNTAIAHTVITNGTVTALGANHWSLAFPARMTAFSPLLELRATDSLTSMTGTVTLPVSGTVVTIEAWKLSSSGVDLATEVSHLQSWLAANENSTGPYLHGNRFVAFFHVGGMEYDGGTTTGVGALKHETFHSWWGRGLKPASQPDAWWDEAWTVYNISGATGSDPLDFSEAPVALCPRNPWIRITNSAAYTEGRRFFEGLAAQIGVSTLKSLMRDFCVQRNEKPATTTDLEEFLVCRSGDPLLVDAFHRFVYGFGDPSPAPDLWIRDDPGHTGSEGWPGPFWNSPDLWIRNADDGGATHQPPEYGQDNWFYARVRNRSASATARHFLVAFNVKAFAGVQFQYPADFLPCIAAASGFELGPGASTVVRARWPAELVPPPGTHACWLAAVLTRSDHPLTGRHVWEHNNLAQKNLSIVDLKPGDWLVLPFLIANLNVRVARQFQLELIRPAGLEHVKASLLHRSSAVFRSVPNLQTVEHPLPSDLGVDTAVSDLDCGGRQQVEEDIADVPWTSFTPHARTARRFRRVFSAPFATGRTSRIPVLLRRHEQLVIGLRVRIPPEAAHGDVIHLDLVKRDRTGERVLGGLAIEIHVV